MISRAAGYYTTGYDGENPFNAPFYLRSLLFDGKESAFNKGLIDSFNRYCEKKVFSGCRLRLLPGRQNSYPSRIAVINASHDNLPTSYETVRVFDDYCREKGLAIRIKVVNTRKELFSFAQEGLNSFLIMSQCVDKHVYNTSLAAELEEKGAVIVPGKVTAPGSVFSDKDSTYKMLSDNGRDWSRVARYKKVETEGRDTVQVVKGIFESIDTLHEETGDNIFFVKPHEGGGGLGGFRIVRYGDGYLIPDLSKVTGDNSNIHPAFIDVDVNNKKKLREILWIYDLFSSDKKLSSNYLQVKLPLTPGEYNEKALQALRDYIMSSSGKRRKKLKDMVLSKEEASANLKNAIDIFQKKFNRRYIPLVNEHIDFGLWGLRAHYRLSRKGPVLETMYHRIFQLGFTAEGIGYLGSDNISNKQTGDLEIMRLGPLNKIMVDSIGGEKALFVTLEKGAEALTSIAELVPEHEKNNVPIRVQLDLAAVSQRIGEGNADTARGLCLASNWETFVQNAREWFNDSLLYYSWKKKESKK
jgi:hypothetical protein